MLRRVEVARRHFSKLHSSWFAYQALHSAEGVDSDDFCQIREPMVNACKYSAIHGKFRNVTKSVSPNIGNISDDFLMNIQKSANHNFAIW